MALQPSLLNSVYAVALTCWVEHVVKQHQLAGVPVLAAKALCHPQLQQRAAQQRQHDGMWLLQAMQPAAAAAASVMLHVYCSLKGDAWHVK
jgi:hypothetical protein